MIKKEDLIFVSEFYFVTADGIHQRSCKEDYDYFTDEDLIDCFINESDAIHRYKELLKEKICFLDEEIKCKLDECKRNQIMLKVALKELESTEKEWKSLGG